MDLPWGTILLAIGRLSLSTPTAPLIQNALVGRALNASDSAGGHTLPIQGAGAMQEGVIVLKLPPMRQISRAPSLPNDSFPASQA